jgi:hypothetical protein
MSMIFCDEAGNSGENLLDPTQPFFVLASNDFGLGEARALLAHVVSPQGGEPKFKTLKKTAAGVTRLTRFFSDPVLNRYHVVVDAYHKRYMVVTKLVDLIAETLAHQMGVDLYERGANLAMSNMLYCCMPAFCGKERTDVFLSSFVTMMRARTPESTAVYYAAARALHDASSDEKFKTDLFPFTEPRLFWTWFEGIGDFALEPAVPALFQHVAEWGNRKPNRFRVIHDQSKPVLANADVFAKMMALAGEESQVVGYDRRKFKFPLRAQSLEQGDSLEYPQLQVADLCAGGIAHFLRCVDAGHHDELSKIVRELGCLEWVINAVAPSTDVTPEALGTDTTGGVHPVDPIVSRLGRSRS